MPLLYTLNQINRSFKDGRKDPANGKWFARATHLGEISTNELAERVSYSTTVTKADTKAVIEALIKEMQTAMNESYIVVLDGIGRFKLGIKSKGALEAEDFSVTNNVVGVHVNFLPAYSIDPSTGRKLSDWTNRTKIRETPKNAVGVVTD